VGGTVATTASEDVWADQRRWSHAANRLKKRLVVWRSVALGTAVAGAVLATLAAQLGVGTGPGFWASIAAAVLLALNPVIRSARLGKDAVETWTRARSASEGLKTEVYLYLTRTPPYDGDQRDGELAGRAEEILTDVRDIAGAAVGQPSADKPVPDVADVEEYLARRVRPQIEEYYEPAATRQQRRLALFRSIEYALALLAAGLGAVAAAAKIDALAAWVAVVTTVAAAVTAHVAAARYEHLVISYLATARQLRFLVRSWGAAADRGPAAVARLVRDCEDVISRENESWMAAWTREPEEAAPAAGDGR
jgi:hypothetical protein